MFFRALKVSHDEGVPLRARWRSPGRPARGPERPRPDVDHRCSSIPCRPWRHRRARPQHRAGPSGATASASIRVPTRQRAHLPRARWRRAPLPAHLMRHGGFPFWRFSMRVYRAPRVAGLSRAAGRRGADISLLLFCAGWGERTATRPAGPALSVRAAASQSEGGDPARSGRAQATSRCRSGILRVLRKRIGAAELGAEYAEQRILARCAAELPLRVSRCEPRTAVKPTSNAIWTLGAPGGAKHATSPLIDACSRPSSPGR